MQHPLSMRNPLRALWSAYERQLQRRPVLTQMTTSAVLWGFGDLAAQRLERYEREQKAAAAAAAAAASGKRKRGAAAAPPPAADDEQTDWRRALLTAAYGGTFVGPVGEFWYKGLDAACARVFASGSPQFIALKVLLDTAVMGPFYVSTFFAFGCAFIDGGGWREKLASFKQKMRTDFVPTLALEMSLWPVVQSFNFWRVPVQHQLLVVNSATIVDAAFMSWARNQDDWLGAALQRFEARGGGGGGKDGGGKDGGKGSGKKGGSGGKDDGKKHA